MRRPKSHVTGDKANRVFENLLPDEWVPHRQHPDYGIDYSVEVFENEAPSGIILRVQVKGTEKAKGGGRSWKIKMSTKNLLDYLETENLPVFVVLVDTEKEEAWWVFIQEYLRLRGDKVEKKLKRQRTLTVSISTNQKVDAGARFREAVKAAHERMRTPDPDTLAQAVRAEQERLQVLDPRFEIKTSMGPNGFHHALTAKEPVDFKFSFHGETEERTKEILRDLLDKGRSVHLKEGEVSVEGMPLLSDKLPELSILTITRTMHLALALLGTNKTESETVRLDGFTGELSGGAKEAHFHASRREPCIKLSGAVKFLKHSIGLGLKVQMGIQEYVGRPFAGISETEEVWRFFKILKEGGKARLALRPLGGHEITMDAGNFASSEEFARLAALAEFLHHAFLLSRVSGVKLVCPEGMSIEDFLSVDAALKLATEGRIESPAPELKLKMNIVPKKNQPETIRKLGRDYDSLVIDGGIHEQIVLGQKICFPNKKVTLTEMRVSKGLSEAIAESKKKRPGAVAVEVVGSSNNQCIIECKPIQDALIAKGRRNDI